MRGPHPKAAQIKVNFDNHQAPRYYSFATERLSTDLTLPTWERPEDEDVDFFAVWYAKDGKAERELVVFVHGYRGDALGTWGELFVRLSADDRTTALDLMSFGYESERRRAVMPAMRLLAALDERAGSYARVTLVAHSLGAIVARVALVEGILADRPWARTAQLVLFAPAHCGSNLFELGEAFRRYKLIDVIGAAFQYREQVLDDLRPGCPTLASLEATTRSLVREGRGAALVARAVVLAENDKVVYPTRFAKDPPPIVLWGCDHVSVCKPDDESDAAVQLVLNAVFPPSQPYGR